jgi:hypothetical protein
MTSGAVTLSDVAKRQAMLEVGCRKCDRRGRYRVANLISKYGADASLPELRFALAADCPRSKAFSLYDECGVYYPNLR